MDLLFQFLSKWGNLALLFVLFILFNILLSSMMPKDHALDLMFAYSAEEAYTAIGQLDFNQRQIYSVGIWVLDMPYMVIYSMLFSGVLIKLWKNRRAVWLPIGVAAMDLFENLMVISMLNLYPVESENLANLASGFTTTKWLLVDILILFLIAGPFFLLSTRRFASNKTPVAGI